MKCKLDKYYTKTKTVVKCLESVDLHKYDLIIEPSAGSGQFMKHLHGTRVIGVDIQPDSKEIIQKDFLDSNSEFFDIKPSDTVACVGNPPFGKNSRLAVDFFNHSAKFCDTIAFILPKTFRKTSIVNRLDPNFHLVKEVEIPADSFYTSYKDSYEVPAVWQVWERREEKRQKKKVILDHPDFSFIAEKHHAKFLIQRVGANAGKTHQDFSKSKSSHYLITPHVPGVFETFTKINWEKTSKYNTAGNPSITKQDVIIQYEKHKQ